MQLHNHPPCSCVLPRRASVVVLGVAQHPDRLPPDGSLGGVQVRQIMAAAEVVGLAEILGVRLITEDRPILWYSIETK
jgi:hypothetical protein